MERIRIFCPAKINTFLAVTGRRADGFHRLVSIVAPLAWGDDLEVEFNGAGEGHRIECDDPDVPNGPENLVWKAAQLFNEAAGLERAYRFRLTKRIPMGSGLGGGSSDAVGALLAMNRLASQALDRTELAGLAARLGSDCPLFLDDGPVVMRGRGEILEPVSSALREFYANLRFLLFKPAFSIGTAWAYGELARHAPDRYLGEAEAEERVRLILEQPERSAELAMNSFEAAVEGKFPAIPLLLKRVGAEQICWAGMSGSGSACYAAVSSVEDLSSIREIARAAWGDRSLLAETRPL